MYICSAKSNCDSDQYDSWLVCFPENFICFKSPYTPYSTQLGLFIGLHLIMQILRDTDTIVSCKSL